MARGGGDGGFALLIVLWTLGLLALLGTQITSAARLQSRIAANLRSNAVAEAAADGAVAEAVLRLMQRAWVADGRPYAIRVGRARVEVRVRDQTGLVNPNIVARPVVQAVLSAVGAPPAQAAQLARSILEWRNRGAGSASGVPKVTQYRAAGLPYGPANRPFESLDEVGLVIGMTPELLARLKSRLSVYQEGGVTSAAVEKLGTDAVEPPKPVDGGAAEEPSRNRVASIRASALADDGGRFVRDSVVRLRADSGSGGPAYQILTWDVPDR